MGRPKALLSWGRTLLVEHVVASYAAGGCQPVFVVLGGRHEAAIRAEGSLGLATVLRNPDSTRGMISTLRIGLRAALRAGAAWVAFGPVDVPLRGSETVASVLDAALAGNRDVYVASFGGSKGHPALISARAARAVLDAPAGATPRTALESFACETVEVADPGVCANLNTPEEVARWRQRMSGGALDGR